ncbi:SGNH/GDSL hydrolase family protein [Limosilactobacillus sp. STM2_1]|uniref:SGNH/GDSL hydrolase family protein n=1 Tax=Limosilactobacillus rudii TaxID=2759755 RepID=A0A7W3UL67_9LACO|nr:SGNH/GDSL hydrolase family protein [Limosilactobacillus rudii]MBB1079563.1 SGNH/GDSL hydrolase family protein [Limosilactobacillus rudii]MBB1097609.1 SGNH/GDSL hydrolase family protein [Limosilactobacillus rudii]MCD7134718.1 SGNH/GDSL hydrolase family protein [Limosilactobacillus rudii]
MTSDVSSLQTFMTKMTNSVAYQRGNASTFNLDQIKYNSDSPLAGKRIAFLGSSVTYGFAAHGVSFVDYLQAQDGVLAAKSAVSGTTLAGNASDGYLARLNRDFSPSSDYDLFVCQLSTNDNRHGKELGHITPKDQRDNFAEDTTLGAIEAICATVQAKFHCPLVFYTCLQNDPHHDYQTLIKELVKLQDKWHFEIIDLFNDSGLHASLAAHPNAMFDDVHPTQEGYLKVWLPLFERALPRFIDKNIG